MFELHFSPLYNVINSMVFKGGRN